MDITNILTSACSHEKEIRQPAEQQLQQFRSQNWPAYLQALVNVLGDANKPDLARQQAGIQLKNAIVSRDQATQQNLQLQYRRVDQNIKAHIQQLILFTLKDRNHDVRSTAALVIGKIAAAEVPHNGWPNLIEDLVKNCTSAETNEQKEASFQALGLVCEECPEQLQPKANHVLNAIAQGMYKGQKDNKVKLAATQALSNALEFTRENFSRETERNQIMTMVFQAASCDDVKVREAAFMCLVEIATTYYDLMQPFIKHIFMLTAQAIKQDSEGVALQAIEFWSSICEVEEARIAEYEEMKEKNPQTQLRCHGFAKQSIQALIPLILEGLTKQNEDFEDDTWNIAMASATCLGLYAMATRDDIVAAVYRFLETNLSNANWRYREAATLVFGSILDGPSRETLAPIVKQAFAHILSLLKDNSNHVQDTAAWTIGRICDLLPEVIGQETLPMLMAALNYGLEAQPTVAAHVCWAIHNLAEAVEVDDEDETSPLSPYFQGLMGKLLKVSERNDAGDTNLIPSAYHAINLMVTNAAKDSLPLIEQLLGPLIQRLQTTFTVANRGLQIDILQGLLCGSLQCVITKLPQDVVMRHANAMMELFLRVLEVKNATVHEEAFLAIGAIASKVGDKFERYMGHFAKALEFALRNHAAYQLNIVAVGVVGDLCRALEGQIAKHCDTIMQLLLQNLQNADVNKAIKPAIISTIGDVALAIGGSFERYLPFVMMLLIAASKSVLAPAEMSLDNIDYLTSLRSSILDAYTGILQGLSDGNKVNLFEQFLLNVNGFLDLVARDNVSRDDDMVYLAIGLVGDIACLMRGTGLEFLRQPAVSTLLRLGHASEDDRCKERAQWARKRIEAVLN